MPPALPKFPGLSYERSLELSTDGPISAEASRAAWAADRADRVERGPARVTESHPARDAAAIVELHRTEARRYLGWARAERKRFGSDPAAALPDLQLLQKALRDYRFAQRQYRVMQAKQLVATRIAARLCAGEIDLAQACQQYRAYAGAGVGGGHLNQVYAGFEDAARDLPMPAQALGGIAAE